MMRATIGGGGGGGNGAAADGGSSLRSSGGQQQQQQQVVAVPPGFRFHPTDEELLYYYLRKKVAYEVIDLDVIRDVDLNKLEPWDLKDKCRIGTGPQNEWYFFSHKDKKYPTGTRTNRATNAGFWKATGRDKAIHHLNCSNSKPIGMRKTLVFYTGRAPHGQKTDWIMHEYRLIDDGQAQNLNNSSSTSDHHHHQVQQEDGWVVCRVFKKKNHQRGFNHEVADPHDQQADHHRHQEVNFYNHMNMKGTSGRGAGDGSVHHHHQQQPHHQYHDFGTTLFDNSMHLPQLLSPESSSAVASFLQQPISSLNNLDIECSQNLMKLTNSSTTNTTNGGGGGGGGGGASGGGIISNIIHHHHNNNNNNDNQQDHHINRFNGSSDWSFLDKLLASNSTHPQHHHHLQSSSSLLQDHLNLGQTKCDNNVDSPASMQALDLCPAATNSSSLHKFPFHQYLGCESDVMKFSK